MALAVDKSVAPLVSLHLGCGNTGRPGPDYINCDLYVGPHTDLVFDLMRPWPLEANTVREIYASHVLEHLPDPMRFFREAHRVLIDGGKLFVRVPYGGHRAAWCDPTHLRPYFPETFAFLQPGYNEAVHNPQHNAWDAPFHIECISQRINAQWRPLLSWYWLRKRFLKWCTIIPDAIEELWVEAYALKTREAVSGWGHQRTSNTVPCRYILYQHEWDNTPFDGLSTLTLLDLTYKRPLRAF